MADKSKKESTLYFFTSTGCAFCKKLDPIIEELNNSDYNILKLDLSDKDNQGLKKEIEKEYDIKCGTPLLVDADSGNHVCGYREKDVIEKWANGEKIPPPPRLKTQPPVPPKDWENKKSVKEWEEKYEKWRIENSHMPLIPTLEETSKKLKHQSQIMKQRNLRSSSGLENRITLLEQKIDRLLNHLGIR
jgi:thiol-disulfide isomerase/thioredoxin|tara:strand:+ start:277 stop:843 length:567 start_codon:yes stop_codon:yes gene_type:complete